ncbi:DivIVA domain-containing protein [Fibrisoma montanum]|uniref:DivIVA domain-containing protein n=1 Tax=Fibrisoma montanum TaxID=2305895 RepID=A0A418LZZ2_9BACT|nr:DivIVA domain-containing protein [Fibrisoma montanum]RIV18915.1 DivIVA domain-containing protein [Fibrisoma montanum]
MKITPIEIRQHTFEKGLRGYKPEDVDAFLVSLSQEWERVIGDHKMMKMQLEIAEKELNKLKEVEMTLFRTLKTAEDTSAQITDQANKAAEQYLAEARQKADDILAEARKRSALMVQDAENQARYLKDNILNDLKALEHDFQALEKYKENLSVQIRTLAGNAIDSVDRFEKKFAKQNLKGKIDEVTTQIKEEIDQQEADNQPAGDAPTAEAPESMPEVTELPPLTDRTEFVPEAIPSDEPLMEKVDEAVETSETMESAHESSASLEPEPTQTEAAVPVEATSNGVYETQSATADEEKPEPVAQESSVKKGGSFFDQI